MNPSSLAIVALGSNLGDSPAILRRGIDRLRPLSDHPLRVSSFYQSSPVDCPPGSPDFVNAVVAFHPCPKETPESLLARLQALEAEFGRQPGKMRNAPRPLDLDLIAFGAETRQSAKLTLPHPRAMSRRFVLEPLAEVAPDLILPGATVPVADLLAGLETTEKVERMKTSVTALTSE
jgi:2-amino-4-hydroxy-6-hydroxymethyldihydropteridine diphosphokinase